ncbi:arsenic resistance protein [Alteribacillus sp. HJP-4]|uniref:arsenic resistance protein n=1 Tax=Alteribacillus sp. HJP-4 TaxID=2775394 RepID=UPI0035CD313D
MTLTDKLYPLFIFTAAAIGLSLSLVEFLHNSSGFLLTPFLMGMLYFTFLQLPVKKVKAGLQHKSFAGASLLLNFVWTPLLAWVLAMIFLSGQPGLWLGFIMLLVTPCTDWYLIFTRLSKGNTALSASVLPLNLLLQLLLLPVYLLLFSGKAAFVEPAFLFESILLVLAVPLILAVVTQAVLKNDKRKSVIKKTEGLPLFLLCMAVAAMFTANGSVLIKNLEVIILLVLPLLCFFVINIAVSQLTGRLLGFAPPEKISLSFTVIARNSPIALAIAVTAFPDQPYTALALIIGAMLELPMLAFLSHILRRIKRRTP